MVSREVERQYASITYLKVRTIAGDHPQFDDIVALANVEVWRKLASMEPEERERQHRLVQVIAKQAVCHFLRSPENEVRRSTRDGTPLPARVSWEGREWTLPRVPDFAPRLVERLWRQWVWRAAWTAASPEDRQVLVLYFLKGVGHEEIGRRFGRPPNWSWRRIKRLFNKHRND